MMLSILPEAVYLYIVDFLFEEEQIQCVSTSKEWYRKWMKAMIRKIELKVKTDELDWFRNKIHLLELINNPLQQLSLSLNDYPSSSIWNTAVKEFIIACNHSLDVFTLSLSDFESLCSLIPNMQINHLQLLSIKTLSPSIFDDYSDSDDEDELADKAHLIEDIIQHITTKVKGLKAFTFEMLNTSVRIPYISTINQLHLNKCGLPQPIPSSYLSHSQLQQLVLWKCGVTDVTHLSHIPDLCLSHCHKLRDITSLTHNRKVSIIQCRKIINYSQSFEHSVSIRLEIYHADAIINFSPWHSVRNLELIATDTSNIQWVDRSCRHIPWTVKRCYLSQKFVSVIDLHITPKHQLLSLTLVMNNTLTSLAGLGFDRLYIIRLSSLYKLESLVGIGHGNNYDITINDCNQVPKHSYSCLRTIPIVELNYAHCDEMVINYFHHVQQLTLKSYDPSFYLTSYSFFHFPTSLKRLNIEDFHLSFDFSCLINIPEIVINRDHLPLLLDYCSKGQILANQCIQIVFSSVLDFSNEEDLILENTCHQQLIKCGYILAGIYHQERRRKHYVKRL